MASDQSTLLQIWKIKMLYTFGERSWVEKIEKVAASPLLFSSLVDSWLMLLNMHVGISGRAAPTIKT